jgi:hypothetical protein
LEAAAGEPDSMEQAKHASSRRWKMSSRTATTVAAPILLAALLAAVEAVGQQPDPPDAAACVGGGAIVGGQRQPPTPEEVKARESSPACRGTAGGVPAVDSSPQAGSELEQIYGKLMRIDRSQIPSATASGQ